jgi:sterol carrier protein 2
VRGTRLSLQHNLGLGGAVVVTVYKRADGQANGGPVDSATVGRRNKLGYNPAVEAKGFTEAQADSVRSRTKASAWALGDTQTKVHSRF